MESESTLCVHCMEFRSALVEKENEIQRLKLHIQNMTNFLVRKDSNNGDKLDFNLETHDVDEHELNKTDISERKLSFSDLINLSCDILHTYKRIIVESKSVQTEITGNQSYFNAVIKEEENNEDSQPEVMGGNVHDYVYDNNYQMYYSFSTGYYYDEKSGLMYEPQSRTYYKYNYDRKEYEKVSHKESNDLDEASGYMSEAVVDQVNNLNLNDESTKTEKSEVEDINYVATESSTNENESCNVINLEKSGEADVSIGTTKDWYPTEGSKLTVRDMVRQVVDEHDNMSDYIYDEVHQMYYSPSTGYFFDAIKKLLYDPSSGIYYFYDADKQTYEFYCQIDPNTSDQDKLAVNQDSNNLKKLKCRKLYWKKKLEHSKQSPETLKSCENNNEEISEEEFSSPEEGEIFSSDDESSPPVCIIRSPVKGSCLKNQRSLDESYPPSIRAIVENSENLQIGSLILITCFGGIVGRDKMNAVYIPDICVSKMHAKIKYNAEFQNYSIQDLGSQNGTFVNEERLSEPKVKSEPCTLNHGDKLSLGSCKLLLHIHEGYETCDNCEPGQVLAEISSNTAQTAVYMSKEEKEKSRRKEIRRLKKKYGLHIADFERKATQRYEDKAESRRQTVGSDNPYEKTQEASVDILMPETNKGYRMLKKMGWKEGQTLGTTDSGLVEPIPFRPWSGTAGLGSPGASFAAASNPEDRRRAKKRVKARERYFQLSLRSDTS